jgi:isopentenyl-diphosphate delta-isomerase
MNVEEVAGEWVILVNGKDEQLGTEEKLRAHRLGLMHRAFSVFVVNGSGQVLLQRRAAAKYHSAGLWSNTTCGHPRPGEDTEAAAHRRLREEMGFDCPLTKAFDFTYQIALTAALTEHELDHVFVGVWNGDPSPDPDEVAEWTWTTAAALDESIGAEPATFSAWLPIVWAGVRDLAAVNRAS